MSTSDIIGVIHSSHLKKGLLEGYGLLVTPEKIVGAKKFKMGAFAALMADETNLSIPVRMEAYEAAKEIEKHKEFELSRSQVLAIEVKKPGTFRGGHLLITSTSGEHKVKLVAQMTPKELQILLTSLSRFAPSILKTV